MLICLKLLDVGKLCKPWSGLSLRILWVNMVCACVCACVCVCLVLKFGNICIIINCADCYYFWRTFYKYEKPLDTYKSCDNSLFQRNDPLWEKMYRMPPPPPSPILIEPTDPQTSDQSWLSGQRRFELLAVLRTSSEDADQPALMRRLIWVFAGRTCHKTHFLCCK